MNQENNSFEIGISRHAPKIEKRGEIIDVMTQEVDKEAASVELTERAKSILENLEKAPDGAIMAFAPSNIRRTEQTIDIFTEKLTELLANRDDIEILSLSENSEKSISVLEKIKNNPSTKYIMVGLRGSWLIGAKEDNVSIPVINKWKNILNGDENLLGKIWATHKDEIPSIIEELKSKGINIEPEIIKPSEFKSTPEDQIIHFLKWIQAMKKIGENHFSDRPLILEGISHNLRSDYTMLSLFDEDISLESINRVLGGEFRKPFERSSIIFEKSGSIKIKYREIEKIYSSDEFENIIKKVKERRENRKREWEGLSV